MSSRGRHARRSEARRVALTWVGWWLALAVLWIAIDDTRQVPELVLGALTATVSASAVALALHRRAIRLELPGRVLRRGALPLWRLVADTGLLARGLFTALVLRRKLHGSFRAVRFAGGESPADLTRRALAEWVGSLAANRYVIGIDRDGEYMLIHELVASEEPLDPMGLG